MIFVQNIQSLFQQIRVNLLKVNYLEMEQKLLKEANLK